MLLAAATARVPLQSLHQPGSLGQASSKLALVWLLLENCMLSCLPHTVPHGSCDPAAFVLVAVLAPWRSATHLGQSCWDCRFARHIAAHAELLEPEVLLPDPVTGVTPSNDPEEIRVEAILPRLLGCSMKTWSERLAKARACGPPPKASKSSDGTEAAEAAQGQAAEAKAEAAAQKDQQSPGLCNPSQPCQSYNPETGTSAPMVPTQACSDGSSQPGTAGAKPAPVCLIMLSAAELASWPANAAGADC